MFNIQFLNQKGWDHRNNMKPDLCDVILKYTWSIDIIPHRLDGFRNIGPQVNYDNGRFFINEFKTYNKTRRICV